MPTKEKYQKNVEYYRAYQRDHPPSPEKKREHNQRFYWSNREEYLRRQKERYELSPESHRAYSRSYYASHTEERRRYAQNRRLTLGLAVRWYKQIKGCMDCGEINPIVLDFDHVRGEKKFVISGGYRSGALSTLWAEIQKCDVVCANCHRIRTYDRLERRIEWPPNEKS